MTKLIPVKPEKIIKLIEKLGFRLVHVKGSHHVYKHPDGRMTVIPMHKGRPIGKGLLLHIIKEELKMTKEEFYRML